MANKEMVDTHMKEVEVDTNESQTTEEQSENKQENQMSKETVQFIGALLKKEISAQELEKVFTLCMGKMIKLVKPEDIENLIQHTIKIATFTPSKETIEKLLASGYGVHVDIVNTLIILTKDVESYVFNYQEQQIIKLLNGEQVDFSQEDLEKTDVIEQLTLVVNDINQTFGEEEQEQQ